MIISGQFQFTPLREGRHTSHRELLREEYFNSRPSARGDTTICATKSRGLFQFTPLREGRHNGVRLVLAVRPISIHAPPRGATSDGSVMEGCSEFQFTPLREGRPFRPSECRCTPYFNSRPSARGDSQLLHRIEGQRHISIHAPPRGATSEGGCALCCNQISIHAPPRGATAAALAAQSLPQFQFTPLREGRRFLWALIIKQQYFNSRPSARGDH